MAAEDFHLKWSDHHSNLISVLDLLLNKQSFVDVTLAAQGRFLNVHRIVLCACSPYFAELLSENCEKQAIVILRDVSFENLRALVDFVYRGEVNVPQGQLSEFLRTTESLQIKGLASYYLANESRQQPITEPTRQMCQMRPENISDADHPSSAEAAASLVRQSAEAAKVVQSPQVPSEEQNNDEHIGTESREDRVPAPRSPSEQESSTSNDVAGPSALNGSRAEVREKRRVAGKFLCRLCTRKFKSKQQLAHHLGHECGIPPRFACPMCPFRTNNQPLLGKHLQNKHAAQSSDASHRTSLRILVRRARKTSAAPPGAAKNRSSVTSTTTTTGPAKRDPDGGAAGKSQLDDAEKSRLEQMVASRTEEEFENLLKSLQADDEKLYHCPQCPRVYKVKYSLVRHLTSECGIPPRFSCPRCPYRSHYELNLAKHMKASWCRRHSSPSQSEQAITSDEDSSGSCDEQESDDPPEQPGRARNGEPGPGSASKPTNGQCALQDELEAKWVKKMLQQVTVKTGQCPCAQCGRCYKYKESLVRHLRFECRVLPRFSCTLCPYKATYGVQVREHLRQRHPGRMEQLGACMQPSPREACLLETVDGGSRFRRPASPQMEDGVPCTTPVVKKTRRGRTVQPSPRFVDFQ